MKRKLGEGDADDDEDSMSDEDWEKESDEENEVPKYHRHIGPGLMIQDEKMKLAVMLKSIPDGILARKTR